MSSIPASGTPPVSSHVLFARKPFLLFFTARRLSKFCFQISAVVSVVIQLSLVQLSTPDAMPSV
jgi:hypothetical protein